MDGIRNERNRRLALWDTLHREGGTTGVLPHRLRQLGIYGGAQGVWVDKARTAVLSAASHGVTVGLLHTGSAYADDLDDQAVLYHYPRTRRPPGRDFAEIEATKAAGELGLPVFVITYPSPKAPVRTVRLGWVDAWDDGARLFFVPFGNARPKQQPMQPAEDAPFALTDTRSPKQGVINLRQGQQRFKFLVLQRYGAHCAVCGLDVVAALDAAHVRPKREHGTNDPRNGLVLCASHHRAFDAGLFAIEPDSLRLRFRTEGPTAATLRITKSDIQHLKRRPHPDAIQWLWRTWTAGSRDATVPRHVG